eukprot:GAHX01000335.1.p1 GENE.GAHX01000335.1~~GAHX01000335.1.p1  ORF type:complete len:283 (+),score=53.09 GAHX01000335.1:50-898(+)
MTIFTLLGASLFIIFQHITSTSEIARYNTISFATRFRRYMEREFVLLVVKNESSTPNYTLTKDKGKYTLKIHPENCGYVVVDYFKDSKTEKKLMEKHRENLIKQRKDMRKAKGYEEKLKIEANATKEMFALHKSMGVDVEKKKCEPMELKQSFMTRGDQDRFRGFSGMKPGSFVVYFYGDNEDEDDVVNRLFLMVEINDEKIVRILSGDEKTHFNSFTGTFTSKILIDAYMDILKEKDLPVGLIIAIVCIIVCIIVIGFVLVLRKKIQRPNDEIQKNYDDVV